MTAKAHVRGSRGERRGPAARHGAVAQDGRWSVLVPGAMEAYVTETLGGGLLAHGEALEAFAAAWEGAGRGRRGKGVTRELSGFEDVMRVLWLIAQDLLWCEGVTPVERRAARTVVERLTALRRYELLARREGGLLPGSVRVQGAAWWDRLSESTQRRKAQEGAAHPGTPGAGW